MSVEREKNRGKALRRRHFDRATDHCLMAQVHTIERPDAQDRARPLGFEHIHTEVNLHLARFYRWRCFPRRRNAQKAQGGQHQELRDHREDEHSGVRP